MGLIRAFLGGFSQSLKDQWKEYFYCDRIPDEAIMVRGYKQNTKNNKGDDNVITNGSKLVVADGQCAVIVEDGRIVEICAEPGGYTYNNTVAPTVFEGGFGKGLVASFKKALENFTYGGSPNNYQRIYYFNTREIMGNRFGTPTPIPFRVVDNNIGLDIDVSVRCHGTFTYRLVDPMLFNQNLGGPINDAYSSEYILSQIKSEFLDALNPAFAQISELCLRPNQLPGHTAELREAMNAALHDEWETKKGITIVKIALESVTIPPEDQEMIKKAQMAAINRNPGMAAASLVTAQAQAMQDAANNPNGGAMMGFMGMGMAQQAGGMNAQQLFAMQQQQQQAAAAQAPAAPAAPAPAAPAAAGWTCSCGTTNTGKFCMNCGNPQPAPAPAQAEGWTCSCGTVNQGKFCMNCGNKKPADAPLYKCPECGDIFDDSDVQ